MNDDAELLRRYAEEGANDAFAELVRRHVNLVYSIALRQLNGDAHLAADATQIVFVDLARKARTLVSHRVLAGWLFTSTRFVAAKLVRSERRRHCRELEAQLMPDLNAQEANPPLDWQRVRPVLDEALAELNDSDREVILLRFFEERDYASVGARFNLTDNTARMRVERALEKLRARLERRGVTSTSAALGVALANQAVIAAPAGLAATVAGAAIAGGGMVVAGASAGASGTAAAAGFMSMTKLQLGLSGALAMAGATGLVVQAGTNAQLRDEIATLRQQNSTLTTLEAENRQLARTIAEANDMKRDDAEFVRLQEEAAGLKTKLQQIARTEQQRAAQARAEVFEISRLDRQPRPTFQARPQYPFEMRRAGKSGQVVVDFVVDANGDVTKAYAVRSTEREFETSAVEAVSKWKFTAGQKGGHEVATHMQVPIVFALPGGTPPPPLEKSATQPTGAPFTVQLQAVQVSGNGAAEPAPGGK